MNIGHKIVRHMIDARLQNMTELKSVLADISKSENGLIVGKLKILPTKNKRGIISYEDNGIMFKLECEHLSLQQGEYDVVLGQYDADAGTFKIGIFEDNLDSCIEKQVQVAIKKGIDEKTAKYLIDEIMVHRYKFSSNLIECVVNSWKEYPDIMKEHIPSPFNYHFVETNNEVHDSIALILDGNANLRYCGIQSTGKTTLAEQVAALLQRPFLTISGCEETSVEDFNGDFTIVPQIINGKTLKESLMEIRQLSKDEGIHLDEGSALISAVELSKPEVLQAVEFQKWYMVLAMQYGAILHIDEVDQIRSNILIKQHSALDGRRSIHIRGIGTVNADENFTVIATMNGTERMLEATESRFVTLALNPPADIKPILEMKCKKASENDIRIISSFYKSILKAYENDEIIGAFVSIRSMINAINHKNHFSLKRSVELNCANISWNDKESLAKVKDLIQLHIN